MRLHRTVAGGAAAAALAASISTGPAAAGETEAMIESALSAAPPQVAAGATVMTMKGDVLRQGDGAFTCFPYEGPGTAPMCLDAEWMRWADAWMNRKDFRASRVGLAYMLAGDPPDGGASNIDPFAAAPADGNQWVVEGPHVMIIVPDPATLDGVPDDPDAGGPYVMWRGTPYAHIMLPVAPRPE